MIKFWKEYIEMDLLDRDKKLKMIVDRFEEIYEIKDKKLRKQTLKIMLLSYFDDLIDTMYEMKWDENENNK